jgi:hypothetical protein
VSEAVERRPHLQRFCPIPGCDWVQVTSWFVGGPDVTEPVPPMYLRLEAEEHLLSAHYRPSPHIFT